MILLSPIIFLHRTKFFRTTIFLFNVRHNICFIYIESIDEWIINVWYLSLYKCVIRWGVEPSMIFFLVWDSLVLYVGPLGHTRLICSSVHFDKAVVRWVGNKQMKNNWTRDKEKYFFPPQLLFNRVGRSTEQQIN